MLSEVPLLDDILRLSERTDTVPFAFYDELFQAVVKLLGHRRTGEETHLFVKLDSWHIFFYETIRRLYPSIPMILLYRSPDSVVNSHRSRPGMQSVPGLLPAHWFGLKSVDVVQMNSEAYTAHVLSCYLTQFRTVAETDTNAFLLPYRPDGTTMMQQLTRQLNLRLSVDEWELIHKRSGFHAKYPGQLFTDETPTTTIEDYLTSALHQFNQLNIKASSLQS